MSRHASDRHRALALAALDTTGVPLPPGERPSSDEIRRWIDDRVSPERAAEIDAHTALDPTLHAEWLVLRRAALDDVALRRATARRHASRRRRAPPLATPRKSTLAIGIVIAVALGTLVAVLTLDG